MERHTSSNIFKKRVLYSVLSICVLQQMVLFVLLCFAHFDPWRPFEWVLTAGKKVVTVRIWFCFIALGALISVQCFLYSQDFVAQSKIPSSRFSQLRTLFSFNYWVLLNLHMVVWGMICWMNMQLFEIYLEDVEDKCVNEKWIVLLANGIWFGAYFLIFDCRNVQKPLPRYLQFPIIHQLRFLQIKMSLFPIFKQSIVDALSPTLVFFGFYLWKGNTLREIVYEYHGLAAETCKNTSYGVWAVSTFSLVWFFTSIAFNIIYSMKLLFIVYLTEYYSFPVTAPFGSVPLVTLHEALLSNNSVVMQLGYLDLRVLAEKGGFRRDELFTLSNLGGHPHNWNATVETALKMIRDFSDKLKVAMREEPTVTASAGKIRLEETSSKPEVSPRYKSVLRNLSPGRFEPTALNPLNMTVLAPAAEETVLDIVARQIKGAFGNLVKKPGIQYFFGDRVELNVHHVLAQAQPVIWAVDGLSMLTASSVVLDKYGVALKDLPALITSLVDLKQVLDRLHKMSTFKKELRSYQGDVKIRLSLQAAVKRSLYRITIAFQNCINELHVASGVMGQLKPFIHFKEG